MEDLLHEPWDTLRSLRRVTPRMQDDPGSSRCRNHDYGRGHLAAILEYQLQQDGTKAWLDMNLCRTNLWLPTDHLLQSPPGCSWACRFTGLNHSWITELVSADGTTPRMSTSLFPPNRSRIWEHQAPQRLIWTFRWSLKSYMCRGHRGFPTLLMGSYDSTLLGKEKQRTHSLFTCKF